MSILFFDIDNTLFSHRTFTVPASAMEALRKAKAKGSLLFLCSGRNRNASMSTFEPGVFDGALTGSGACGTFHGNLLFTHAFAENEVRTVMDLAVRHNAYVSMQGIDNSWMDEELMQVFRRSRPGFDFRKSMNLSRTADYRGEQVLKFDLFFHENTDSDALLDVLPSSLHVCRVFSQSRLGTGCEITDNGVNKGNAVRETLEILGIDVTDSYGFGDSENDLELVKMCGTGIAMGNGTEALKQAADYVTSDIEEDGIARALEHFHLI